MDRKRLEALNKEELIEIIMQQYEQMVIMQAAFEKLRADYEALKMKFEQNQKPPTSSQNSSQPPSRDQKGNASKEKRRHRHGPPKGHEKHERKLIADANHVIEMRAKRCQDCEARLEGEQGQLVKVNQITELPEAKAQVIEVRYYEVECPCCGQKQLAQSPVGLEMGRRFGARLEATVVYYRQEQHMSYQRTQKAMLELHGVTISQGGIDKIMKRGGKQAQGQVGAIETAIQQNPVIHCDDKVVGISEAYTSQTCHQCGKIAKSNRKHRGFYQCSCGWSAHADINSAANIFERFTNVSPLKRSSGAVAVPVVLPLRNSWHTVYEPIDAPFFR